MMAWPGWKRTAIRATAVARLKRTKLGVELSQRSGTIVSIGSKPEQVMDKSKIISDFEHSFNSKRTVSTTLLSVVTVFGGTSLMLGLVGLALSVGSGVSVAFDTMTIAALLGSLVAVCQGAVLVLVGEIGWVVRDHSGILRRVSAGMLKPTAALNN